MGTASIAPDRRRSGAAVRVLACLAGVSLAACAKVGTPTDWRAAATADAEEQILRMVSDPSAQFSRVLVTGDDKTGQTCGYVTAKGGGDGVEHTVRFIVYIDRSAGPFVDPILTQGPLSPQGFDRAWAADCVREGYLA